MNHLSIISVVSTALLSNLAMAQHTAIFQDAQRDNFAALDISPTAGIETLADSSTCTLRELNTGQIQMESRVSLKIKTADGSSKLYDFDIRSLTGKFPNPFDASNSGWEYVSLYDDLAEDGSEGFSVSDHNANINNLEEILCENQKFNVISFPNDNIFVVARASWHYIDILEWDNSNGTYSHSGDFSGFSIQAHNATTGARSWKKSFVTGGKWLLDNWLTGVGDYLPASGLEYRLVEEDDTASRTTFRYTYFNLSTGAFISSHKVVN